MRLIFAGTPDFAAAALGALIRAGHDIALVLTQPDKPAGRGMKLSASAVKLLALEHRLPLLQPASLKSAEVQKTIDEIKADTMIVAAYGLILPQALLNLPRLGCLNIHASLLPRWRGAAPIHRAIEAGDKQTGITIMQMDAGLDTGDMLLARAMAIEPDDTTASLHDKLAELGAQCIVDALARQQCSGPGDNKWARTKQPSEGVTYAHKITKQEARIDWRLSATEIERKIRAFNPYPIAFTQLKGETLRIWRAQVAASANHAAPGTINIHNNQIVTIDCGSGGLQLDEVQKPGGKRISSMQFLASNDIKAGDKFDV